MSDYFSAPMPGQRPAMASPMATPQVWPGAATVAPPAPSAVPGWPPYTGQPLSGGALAGLIAAAAFGAVLLVGILAAVAIPVFLQARDRAQAANTSVVMPEQVVGLSRLHDTRSLQMEEQLRAQPGNPVVGVFGSAGSVRAAVAVTRHSMSSQDQRDYFAGAETAWQSQGTSQMTFTPVDPGSLGGAMRCGTAQSQQFTICLFVDPGAFGTITLFGELAGSTDTPVAIREAVEHRR